MEWTQERIQRFWEKCGFHQHKERYLHRDLPEITDLNALFEWAVPKLLSQGLDIDLANTSRGWAACIIGGDGEICIEHTSPALALAGAIEKALEVK